MRIKLERQEARGSGLEVWAVLAGVVALALAVVGFVAQVLGTP